MKSKVKKHWVLMIFQFFCSPFFQWNGYFQCQCTTHDITAHRPIFAHTAAAACSLLLKSSSDVKCKVRNLWVLIIFQFFCLPFLQWNSTFSAHAPHMISQPIDQFLPCCCRCLPIKQQCKKNGEKPSCFLLLSHFTHLFHQIADFGENTWFVVAMATVAETTAAAVVRQQQLQQLLLSQLRQQQLWQLWLQ